MVGAVEMSDERGQAWPVARGRLGRGGAVTMVAQVGQQTVCWT